LCIEHTEEIAVTFDAIVIGSGFGGAVTALRLAEYGHSVLVLERGRRWDKSNFPRGPEDPWLWSHTHPEAHNGWLDLRIFPNITVAQGAAVGGGSLIYANVSEEAPRASFDSGWPPEITYGDLKQYYDRVADMMDVRPVPDGQWTKRMELMRDAAAAAGYADRFRKAELAVRFDAAWTYARDFDKGEAGSKTQANKHGALQGTCVHLGTCDIGCAVMARNTLDLNYLYVAENRHHVDVRPLCLVDCIAPRDNGWRVHFARLEGGQRIVSFEDAKLVVVAAGSLGSTELMLRNRDIHATLPNLSLALGQGWSSNGDFVTPAVYPSRKVNPSAGPTIASIIDFEDRSFRDQQFWVQDGGLPKLAVAYLAKKIDDPAISFKAKMVLEVIRRLLRKDDPLRNFMPWFAQGVDAANGRLMLSKGGPFSRGGELQLEWQASRSYELIETIIAMHKKLSETTNGHAFVPPTWSLFRDLITPHPLGGCNMGTDASTGVVDHTGAVFGYPNFYVVDGAVVPRALGVNPSRTIAALAERSAVSIAQRLG
jgi:cholesterol oxidase